jgi:hypothetical protein
MTLDTLRAPRALALCALALFACDDGDDSGVTGTADADVNGEGVAACPAPSGPAIVHDANAPIEADETWAGDGAIHEVPSSLAIRGATLTIEPCAYVRLGPEASLQLTEVEAGPANLWAHGEADHPVVFQRLDAARAWGAISSVYASSGVDLEHVRLVGGGATAATPAVIDLRGTDTAWSTPILRAAHVIIDGSESGGVALTLSAGFTPDSDDLTVTGTGSVQAAPAVRVGLAGAGSVPVGAYTGNAVDAIAVAPGTWMAGDATLPARGVPVAVEGDIRVYDPFGGATPTLTVEAGATVTMIGRIEVGDDPMHAGVLRVEGTAPAPVRFTSASDTPAPGDWVGFYFEAAAGSRLSHVDLAYAGGDNQLTSANCRPENSEDHAAIVLTQPADVAFEAVSITHCGGHGINAIWSAPSFGPDLTGAFGFDDLAGCRQTRNALDAPATCTMQYGCLVD